MRVASKFVTPFLFLVWLPLTAATAPLTIVTTSPLPQANVGTLYSTTLTASGGVTPHTWSATGLPPGLGINSQTGVISGTPTFIDTFTVNVTVKDKAGTSVTKKFLLSVLGIATLLASPTTLNFKALAGQKAQSQSIHIQVNSNPANVQVQTSYVGATTGWLTPTQSPSSLDYNVTPDAGLLPGGTYMATLTVSCTGQTCNPSAVPVNVIFTVTPPLTITCPSDMPNLVGNPPPTCMLQATLNNGSFAVTLTASNGVPPYTWSATGLPSLWTLNPTTGVITGNFIGTSPVFTVTVRDSQGTLAMRQFSLTVSGTPTLTVSPSSMTFMTQTGQNPVAQSLHITINSLNPPNVQVAPSYNGSVKGWLGTQSTLPGDYSVAPDARPLPAGTYSGALSVSCAGCLQSPAAVAITLVVASQSTLSTNAAPLSFQAYQGRSNPSAQTFSLTSNDGSPLGFSVMGPTWLQISPMSGTASSIPSVLTVTAITSALTLGSNTGSITITPANGSSPVVVNATATLSTFSILVSPNPVPAVNLAPGKTQLLPFDITTSDGLLQDVLISVKTNGGGNWLKSSLQGIQGPGRANNVTIDTSGMSPGAYIGAVTFTCNPNSCTPVQVQIALNVSSVPASDLTTIRIDNVISASAFGGFSMLAPGSFIEIYGTNLSTTNPGRTWSGDDFTNNGQSAPTSLDHTTVTVGGQAAFVYYVSPGQVNALVPSNAGTGPSQLTVTSPTGTSAPYPITINPVQPGFLAPPQFQVGGKQYVGAIIDGVQPTTFALPAGAIVGVPSRPVKPGEMILIYGVGFGPVNPQINAGTVVLQANVLTMPLQISFGSTPAQLSYSGLAPSFTGLYQFNVAVPAVPDSDAVPLTLNLGGVNGTQTLYIAVHR